MNWREYFSRKLGLIELLTAVMVWICLRLVLRSSQYFCASSMLALMISIDMSKLHRPLRLDNDARNGLVSNSLFLLISQSLAGRFIFFSQLICAF